MPVLTREALESSPLADLHALAAELKLDGFRRLRKADLVDALLERQGGEDVVPAVEDGDDDEAPRARRSRRGGRGRSKRTAEQDGSTDEDAGEDAVAEDAVAEPDVAEPDVAEAGEPDEEEAPARARRARGGRSAAVRDRDDDTEEDEAPAPARRGRARSADRSRDDAPAEGERIAEGVVELLGNGSGFVRVNPPEPSEDDVYVSAAQVRRCELVSGDRVSGPVRKPRRSERYPSLLRIDTINGAPADEVAEGTPYDEQPATFPSERFVLGTEDPTLKAIEFLTPLGRGSRAVITGGGGAGKTEALRLLAGVLAGQEGLDVAVVLAGVRPEEVHLWKQGPAEVAGALSFAAGSDALAQLVDRAVETAKRVASRGGHAVLLVDGLDGLHPQAARRALAAARAFVDGGSLTIIGTAREAYGGETTVIALDATLTQTRRFPALDLTRSATVRPELLVGEAGADAIAEARLQALGG